MAFPVPDHLPKRPLPVDVSSKILYKIDAATKDTLNSSLAASWLQDLDQSIQETKQDIHDRIQANLPKFQQQLQTATSAQSRFNSLNAQVDELADTISHPKTGLLPNVIAGLKAHSDLAQETSDARVVHGALQRLQKVRDAFLELADLAKAGKLPDAVTKGQQVDELVKEMPEFLQQTHVANDLKRRFTATKTRVQDQLSDAFTRSIVLSPTEFTINTAVQVRQSEAMLELPAILNSITPTTLTTHLNTLRRDFLTYFVDHVLKQPYSIVFENSLVNQAKLTLVPSPPNTEDLSTRLDNVSNILGFLFTNVIAHLPPQESTQFMRSLSKPITTSVLENLLKPALPFSFGLLPSYLQVLKHAVTFEETEISGLLQNAGGEGAIKEWSDNVSGHYERRRRVEILEHARNEILGPDDVQDTFVAYTEGGPETSLPSVVPIQIETGEVEDDAWGLDEPVTAAPTTAAEDTANGWGFDDDMDGMDDDLPDEPEPAPEADVVPEEEEEPEREKTPEPLPTSDANDEPDPDDAWGWNDDSVETAEPIPDENVDADENMEDDNPWDDDPWADPPTGDDVSDAPPAPKSPITPVAASVVSPKAATRLEKLASKKVKHINGNGVSSTSSTPAPTPPALNPDVMFTAPSPTIPEHNPPPKTSRLNPGKRRPQDVVTTLAPKEVYKVPKRAKRIIKMVETSIDESKLFFASNLFGSVANSSFSAPGSVLVQSASNIVDLFQALYPVKFATGLQSAEKAMLFSNMCLYMSGAVQRVEDTLYGQSELKERLTETRKQLQILGDSWYDDTVERQCRLMNEILVNGAQGFAYTTDQDRYDDCEAAVNDVLKKIKSVAHSLKDVLTRTKYYAAIGSIVESVLSRVLADILALPDITEVESHRLSELCRILNAAEFLFSEDPQQPSFVVASVPSWLKFSYLSELLEASLVDVTYLFEQGALVDFQVDELVNLVRALFADTTLRANTITKIQGAHPASR